VIETYVSLVRLRFFVEDNGIGIKAEDQSKLFKMFGKVGCNNAKINPQGIGLGLTICNKILGQMGS
jgi:K+-sensing histidine kinase KdpD